MVASALTTDQIHLLRQRLSEANSVNLSSDEVLVNELSTLTGLSTQQVSEFIQDYLNSDQYQTKGPSKASINWAVAMGMTLASHGQAATPASPAVIPSTDAHRIERLGDAKVRDDIYVIPSALAPGKPTAPTLTARVSVESVFVMPPNLEFALLQYATNADGHLKEKELLEQLSQARSGGHLGDRIRIRLAHQSDDGSVSDEQSLSAIHQAHGFEWDPSTTIRLPEADGRLLAWVELTEAQSPAARLEQSLRVLEIEQDKIQGINQAINQSASQLQNQSQQTSTESPRNFLRDASLILNKFMAPAQITSELLQQLADALRSARLRKQIAAAGGYVAPQSSGAADFSQKLEKNKPEVFVVQLDSHDAIQFRCNLADALQKKSSALATAYRNLTESGETLKLTMEVLKREAPEFPPSIPHQDFAGFLTAIQSETEGSLQALAKIGDFWTPVGRRATSSMDMASLSSEEALSQISAIRVGKASQHQDYVRKGDRWQALEE